MTSLSRSQRRQSRSRVSDTTLSAGSSGGLRWNPPASPVAFVPYYRKFIMEDCKKASAEELRLECQHHFLPSSGSKAVMCARIRKYLSGKKILRKRCKPGQVLNSYTDRCGKPKKQCPVGQTRDVNTQKCVFKRSDWMQNPCNLLKNIKKNIKYGWTDKKMIEIADTLPMAHPVGVGVYEYENTTITIGALLASGSYGSVYKGEKNDKDIVVKMLKVSDVVEFMIETMIQTELYCAMTNRWGTGARIPKIEFVCSFLGIGNKRQFMVGMEKMEGVGIILQKPNDHEDPMHHMRDISVLLAKLQKEYSFMHRDLHQKNIMWNKNTNGKKTMYIIDFGMSAMKMKGRWINRTVQDGSIYSAKDHMFNPSHDLRMLAFNILEPISKRSTHAGMFQFVILNMLARTPFYIARDHLENPAAWHTSYDMHRTIDYNFVPENMMWFMGQAAKRAVIPMESYLKEPIRPKNRLHKRANLKYSQELQLYLGEAMRSLNRS